MEGTYFSISGHSYIYLTPFIMAYENLDDNHDDDDDEKEDDTHEQKRKDEKKNTHMRICTHTYTCICHTVVSRVLNEQEAL